MNRPEPARAHRYPLHDDEPAGEPRSQEIGYTGFWKRFGAGFLDLGFAAALSLAAKSACEMLQYPSSVPTAMLASGVFYFLILTPFLISSRYRASPGKVVFGVVVTDINGRQLSFFQALLREMSKYVSLLIVGLGFVLIGFTEKKQGLHDLLALTVVTPRSEAHLLTYNTPANAAISNRNLLFGKVITGCAILGSVLVVLYFGIVLHETVTPRGLAAHSVILAADSVADTKYPGYSLVLYDTATDLEPNDTEILIKKVYLMREVGRGDEAQTCLNHAMIANPDDSVPVIAAGDLMYADGQYLSSIRYYEKALSINREDADVWIRKGDAHLALSKIEMLGIREQYKTLTSGNAGPSPSSEESTMDAFRSTESYREAIKAYNEAIRIDPFTSVEISGRI
ncbi:MAG: RDD family protein, partial [Methanoregula sp.]|nr:RDD family protein [Methanoregula sp.]